MNQMKIDRDAAAEDSKMKARLYTYPNWNESSTVFDFEDLLEDTLLVLCVRARIDEPGHEHDQNTVYIWKGPDFDDEEASNEVTSVSEFTQRVME